jgi:hypothetical protein
MGTLELVFGLNHLVWYYNYFICFNSAKIFFFSNITFLNILVKKTDPREFCTRVRFRYVNLNCTEKSCLWDFRWRHSSLANTQNVTSTVEFGETFSLALLMENYMQARDTSAWSSWRRPSWWGLDSLYMTGRGPSNQAPSWSGKYLPASLLSPLFSLEKCVLLWS